MVQALMHQLHAQGNRQQSAKQSFVSGPRNFILNDLAAAMRRRNFKRRRGGRPTFLRFRTIRVMRMHEWLVVIQVCRAPRFAVPARLAVKRLAFAGVSGVVTFAW